MNRLQGKVAIITGASSGMGAAQAKLFVAEGASVVLADIAPQGEDIAASLGGSAVFCRHDVGSVESWQNVVKLTTDRFGPPTILVNSAGITRMSALAEETTEDFERILKINLTGVFFGMREVFEPMKAAGGGSIVNISSTGGLRGFPVVGAYCTAKWGMRGLARSAAIEFAKDKIRVNTIFPGPIDTPMMRSTQEVLDTHVLPFLPIGRLGSTDEIAAATLFLASDEASYVTGAELAVDGGQTA